MMNILSAILAGVEDHLLWVLPIVAAVTFAEYRWPAGEQPSLMARTGNLVIVVVVTALTIALLNPVIGPIQAWLARAGLVGLIFEEWRPQTLLEMIGATLVYAFVWDFFQYWFHRAEHTFAFLWPVHALHHDEENVNCTTSQRNTFWSSLLHFFVVAIPTLIVCGFQLLPIMGSYLLFKVYSFFNHANIRLDLGPLTPVISGPQWHRLHHARDAEYYNSNYAAFFPIFDIVFGTYRRPLRNEYPATGLPDRPQAPLTLTHLFSDVFGVRSAGAPTAEENPVQPAPAAAEQPVELIKRVA
ncbi:MAG: sterol desaturase family protein [Bradyrhizobiaceae bacterium]|nr:MAG: sterol desaturase family protein [Bradyrhizobiaceae bacterium]